MRKDLGASQELNLALVLAVPKYFRGEELIAQLQRLNFECRRISGLDGSSLSHEAVADMVNQEASRVLMRREISKGEACCVLVHLDAYRELLANKNQWALILEDDVKLLSPENFLNVFSLKVDHPTILKLSTFPNDLLYPIQSKSIQDSSIASIGFQKIRFPTNNADAYFINRAAARIAVESSQGYLPHHTADWPYLWDDKVQFWTSNFSHAQQEGISLIDIDLERSQLAGGENSRRTLFDKIIQNTSDILFVTSLRLQLAGGNGIQYYKSRVMPKIVLWLVKLKSYLLRNT